MENAFDSPPTRVRVRGLEPASCRPTLSMSKSTDFILFKLLNRNVLRRDVGIGNQNCATFELGIETVNFNPMLHRRQKASLMRTVVYESNTYYLECSPYIFQGLGRQVELIPFLYSALTSKHSRTRTSAVE